MLGAPRYNDSMTLPSVKVPTPTGGLCDNFEFDDVAPDEAVWLRDIVPNESANGIRQRNGFIQVNQAYAAPVVHAFGWRMVGAVEGVAQLSDGTVRPLTLTTHAPGASIYSTGISNGSEVMPFVGWREASAGNPRLYFIPNETQPPQVWDGVAAASSTVANAPLNCTCMILWRGRLIFGGVRSSARGHRVWYSNQGDPNAPASQYGNNWVDLIDANTSAYDWIVGFGVAGDYLLVFKRMSTWVIYDPVSFNNRRISDQGAVDWPSICQARGRVYWISAPDKLMSSDGVKVKEECPQAKFVAGEWQRIAGAYVGRTWLAATEDELYVSQQTQDSRRELMYIMLDRKNARGEMPVFRHMHRRTSGLEEEEWNPTSSSSVEAQFISGVWSWPHDAAYTATLVGPRVRKFVFGGYSGAASNFGRLWTIGGFADGDQIQVSADTAESSGAADVLAQYMQRLPFREMEKFERLRRLNFYYRYGIRVAVATERDTKYAGIGFSGIGKPLFSAASADKWMPGLVSSNGQVAFARFRPEARGRSVIVHVGRPLGVGADNDLLMVFEQEAVYRGGKEH